MQWIKNIAIGLKEEYSTSNPYELCKFLNIEIEKVDKDYYLLDGNNSTYFRHFYGQEKIFIRNDLHYKEEEFYLLHELGHALVHTYISYSGFVNIGKLEKQANYFAFSLKGIELDIVQIMNMTLEQVASCEEVPYEPLAQLVNL